MSFRSDFLFVLTTAFIVPFQAHALSCAAPLDPIDAMNAVHLGPDHAIVGYGTFSAETSPAETLLSGHYAFAGVVFQGGEAIPVDSDTIIQSTSCARGIWCDGVPISFIPEQHYLVLFGQNPATGEMGVHAGLCSSSAILALEDADLSKIANCLADGTCAEADLGGSIK